MLRSMTAFGRSAQTSLHGEIQCELRSVNHRYLDISIRVPESLRDMESGIRDMLTSALARGKVEALVRVTESVDVSGKVIVDEAFLLELTKAASRVSSLTDTSCVIDAVNLLQWPGVVTVGRNTVLTTDILPVVRQAVDDLLATREREGRQIAALLVARNEQIRNLVVLMRSHRPQVLRRQRERLLDKLELLASDVDEGRLEQELVYAAQRLDIDEELDRLDAHAEELLLVLHRDEPVGRRLDFLMQEFNREANTISAKSLDRKTTALAVDMKVLIEQMREQVQNVE
ncbi:MAG: YicC family protein [Granulosicoccus sp.]|nr:YicC family protein [Granulosicoccus sp.]